MSAYGPDDNAIAHPSKRARTVRQLLWEHLSYDLWISIYHYLALNDRLNTRQSSGLHKRLFDENASAWHEIPRWVPSMYVEPENPHSIRVAQFLHLFASRHLKELVLSKCIECNDVSLVFQHARHVLSWDCHAALVPQAFLQIMSDPCGPMQHSLQSLHLNIHVPYAQLRMMGVSFEKMLSEHPGAPVSYSVLLSHLRELCIWVWEDPGDFPERLSPPIPLEQLEHWLDAAPVPPSYTANRASDVFPVVRLNIDSYRLARYWPECVAQVLELPFDIHWQNSPMKFLPLSRSLRVLVLYRPSHMPLPLRSDLAHQLWYTTMLLWLRWEFRYLHTLVICDAQAGEEPPFIESFVHSHPSCPSLKRLIFYHCKPAFVLQVITSPALRSLPRLSMEIHIEGS